MATLAARGSGTPATTGTTWANVTNAVDGTAGTNPATYATMTNATASAVATMEITGYGFSSTIGSADTLNSVSVSLRHFENNTGRFASVTFQAFDGATAIGTATTCTLATAARNDVATPAVTLAQLRSSTFKIRVTITGAASTQSRVFSIDQVDVTADYTPLPPAITQGAYRFYADGTETGSTALASQDTAYTADTSAGDVNLQVRVRLQSTNAVAPGATDDWQLQWEKESASGSLADSYPATNADAATGLVAAGPTAVAQSFLSTGGKLTRAGFHLGKTTSGTPTGNLTASLYAHTGTFGTNAGLPTGSPLTTSSTTVTVASLPSDPSRGWSYFDFDGTYTLTNGTPYCIVLTGSSLSAGATNTSVSRDSSTATHAGGGATFTSTWSSTFGADHIFEVYTTAVTTGNVDPAAGPLVDSYSQTNADAFTAKTLVDSGDGQSFLGNGQKLTRAGFYLSKVGAPPGNVRAYLFAHTGTFGTTSAPTGAALATSTTVTTAASLGTTQAWSYFDFDGTYTLVAGTPYVITYRVSAATDTGNCVRGSYDNSSPTHAGNRSSFSTFWANQVEDLIFQVDSTSSTTAVAYASANLTDAAATTNRLGAGSGSFVAGKVSEDGLVDDLGWSANNYTELLYSVTLKQADLSPADTLKFRVLRNGATTGLTYTQVPSITIGSAAPTDRTGTATGAITLAGTSGGIREMAGTATGALTLSGAASGAPVTAPVLGAATGSLTVTGVAAGVRPMVGTATGALAVAGTASGQKTVTSTAAGAVALTGAASGVKSVTATAVGAVTLTGTAAGAAVTAPVLGSAVGVVTVSSSTVGTRGTAGTATGTLTLTGSSSGTKTVGATATGALSLAGVGSGQKTVTATAVAAVTLAGSSSGTKDVTATATGALTLAGAAAGLRVAAGTATGSITLTGIAVGQRTATATATGALELAGSASGQKSVTATVAGAIVVTSSALGLVEGNAVGIGNGAITLTGAATGVRDTKATATGALTVSGLASGVRGRPGVAVGAITLTGLTTGTKDVTATATGNINLGGTAVGAGAVSLVVGQWNTADVVAYQWGADEVVEWFMVTAVPGVEGVATGTLTIAGHAAGYTTKEGHGTGAITFTTTAVGTAAVDILLEDFANFTDAPWTLTGSPTIVAARTGNGASIAGTTNRVDYTIPTANQHATVTIGFAWRTNTTSATQRALVELWSDTNTVRHTRLLYNGTTSQSLSITRDATALQVSATGLIPVNTWVYVELQVTLGDAGVGSYQVRVNGSAVLGPTTADTRNAGTKTVYDTIRLITAASGITSLWDDLYISTGADAAFKGDITV